MYHVGLYFLILKRAASILQSRLTMEALIFIIFEIWLRHGYEDQSCKQKIYPHFLFHFKVYLIKSLIVLDHNK